MSSPALRPQISSSRGERMWMKSELVSRPDPGDSVLSSAPGSIGAVRVLIFWALDIEVEEYIEVVVLLIFGPAVLLIEVLKASLSSTISST